jgi:predicted GNAT family N-acyltransferase
MVLKIIPFDSRRHICSHFRCEKESLDNYILKQASQDLKRRVSTVFVLIDEPEMDVLGYYTLSSYTVAITVLDEAFAKKLPRYPVLPATLLGRLAVDNSQKGKRLGELLLGELLLVDALKKSLDAAMHVSSLAVVAEALDDQALGFYLKYGFQQFRQEPMKSVEELCQNLSI